MKKIRMKLMSGFISMIMAVNLIAPVGVYASVVNDDDTVIEETVTQEEENLDEQMTTTSPDETEKNDEDIQQEETDEVTPTGTVEENTETETSSPFSESKTIGDVTITVKAEAGAFPNDSYLEVKEIASNTDMSSENETLAASYSYDITIYDKDGNEIEPAEGKNVTVSFSMDRIADSNLDTNIYHTSDDGTVTELDITTSGDTATATTDSFSVYTVEFTYGELTYVMNGDSTIKLSDILNSISLTGEVTNVECSDTSLFSATNESGEWIISSHKAFSTTEWMKVTIEDIVYEIKVTDSNNIVANGTCGTNLTWTLDDEGTLTISGTGAMADYNTTNAPWYSQKNSITTVVISNGVTSIGRYAFNDCSSLTSITIPSGVTSIGESAFINCSSLTNITIPSGVTSIGTNAFYGCSSLTSITIPSSVTSIGTLAFARCSSLTSITIPSSVTSIGVGAFDGIASTAVIYYEGTQTDLNKVTGKNNIPTANLKLRSRGGNCGANGDNVKWTYYDNKTLVISGSGAMANYTSLSYIPWNSHRAVMITVIISDGVTSIGDNSFPNCAQLTSITIPNSVTSIGKNAMNNCDRLTSITIPNSVTEIGFAAFAGCGNLSSIDIPDSVKSIGQGAFAECRKLASITIPNSVTSIGLEAFQNIKSDATIHYDGSLSDWNTLTADAAVPSTVTVICSVLASGTCGANGDNVKWKLLTNGTLEISGTGAMADYNSDIDVPWYSQRANIKNVVISDGVTSIGKGAFADCSALTSITIPSGVTSIGNVAFADCSALTSITIPTSVTSIGTSAFYGCTGLTSVTILASVTSIGAGIFYNCSSLTSITIPNSVTSIGDCAFYGCTGLTSVTIPASVTSIDQATFWGCSKLTSITIPASVTSIGSQAFKDMGNAATNPTINFGGTKARWDAFVGASSVGNNVTVNCTKFDITIKAKDQSVALGAAISNTISDVEITSGSLDTGHTLEGITLDAVTSNVTTSGAITPKDAVIKSGTTAINVAENYNITYVPGKLTVTKGTPTVTAPTAKTALVYDGTEQELLATLGSTTGGTLKYRVGDTGTFTTDKPKAKNAGDYKVYYKVEGNASYNDAAGGSVAVTIGTKPLTITADSATRIYDGTALTKNSYTNTSLASGDSISSVTITGSQTVFGNSNNVASAAVIKNAAGDDVTSSYDITYANGTLKVTQKDLTITADDATKTYDGTALTKNSYTNTSLATGDNITSVTITGSQTVFGTSNNVASAAVIKNTAGDDVTSSYNITYTNGTLTVSKKDLTITADDATKTYDGTALTKNSYTNTALAAGDSISSVTITGSQTVFGTSNNVASAAVIKNTAGTDVTSSYNITYTNGTLKVNKKDLTITADDATKTYDGTALTKNSYTNTALATGDNITSVTITGSQTVFGNSNNVASAAVIKNAAGTDVTSSYNITYTNGTLTVSKKDLTITADDATKTYDGTALTKNSYTNTVLATGDSITSVTITGSQTAFGTSNNVASAAVIKNAAGTDVTSSYNITYTNGTLNVTKRDVTVSVADKTVSYNEAEQTGNTSYTFANVAAGDTATITYTPAKGTDASATAYDNGSFADDFKVMSGSTDVTSSYNLKSKTAGKLKINKAAITPTVTIKGWIVGNTPDIPAVTGNKGNGTETIEYKKSTEADAAYTGTVPTAEGTYTVRATIDETANYQGATATAEFKISAKPVVIDNDESDKKSSDDNNETPPDTGYETFMKELKAAAKKGTPQTLTLNWGNSLSYEAMQILKDNPQLTLIFNYKWQGADYSTTIGGGRTVYANKAISWYGPENLRGLYGASLGRRYANSTAGSVNGTTNTPGNGVYVVQRGDSLWKIAYRKLHVSVDYLVQRNNIRNRNRIITGMVLYY